MSRWLSSPPVWTLMPSDRVADRAAARAAVLKRRAPRIFRFKPNVPCPRADDRRGRQERHDQTKENDLMDLVTFKNTQGPIRERYAGNARAALLTLRAKGTADDSAVTCKVETGRGLALAGIHPEMRRLRPRALLRRHAAGSADRLRRRFDACGRGRARHRRQIGRCRRRGRCRSARARSA